MAKQIVNIGTNPNDGTGDPLRTGMDKVNQNFTDLYDNYQSLAGLAANVITKTANNTLYVGTSPYASVVNSVTLAANLENYVSASTLSLYQTRAGMAANVVTLTSNNSNYLGGVIAENYLTSAIASIVYQTQAGMAANVVTLTSNNSAYLNGKLEAALNVNNATTAYGKTENKLSVNNAAYAFGKSEIDLNVNNATTAYGKSEINLNVNNATYVNGKAEGNLNVNNATYVYGKTQENLNVNAASYSVAAYSNQFTVGTSTYFVTNGNIGFGTATPEVKISVKGSRSDTNGYGWFTFSDQGTSNKIGMRVDTNNGFWIDHFNGGSWGVHMGILASGNVGISNTSPGSKLTVGGMIETTTGGIKFPDATTQTTAAVSYSLPTASGSTLGGVKIGTGLSIDGSSVLSVTSGSLANTQIFTSSGSWSKVGGFNASSRVLIQCWGGGGGGHQYSFGVYAAGAGGGGYNYRWMSLGELSASVFVTVGDGGAVGATWGGPGGTSSFGGYVAAYGGGGGGFGPYNYGGAGSGGGQLSRGSAMNETLLPGYPLILSHLVTTTDAGTGNISSIDQRYNGSGGYYQGEINGTDGGYYHGGGGASGSGKPGDGVFGGGGGGADGTYAGGTSMYGGNGGNGGNPGTAGSAPGGGGGFKSVGGRGEVRITVFAGA